MAESELQNILHSAVHRYLSTLSTIGECLADACPAVGGPFRHKLTRLRARLAFDANPETLDRSFAQLEGDMRQYAAQASEHLHRHQTELASAVRAMDEITRTLHRRQEFYSTRLRQLAEQMERTPCDDPERFREAMSAQGAALSSCMESLSHETHSLVVRMQREIGSVEERVAESETTDPVTQLTNRREMERQIANRRRSGTPITLLHFETAEPMPDDVARQVAARLWSQFRPHDIVARWTAQEFMVLFLGPPEIAESRVTSVVPWISGRYPLTSGESIEVQMHSRMYESELVAAH